MTTTLTFGYLLDSKSYPNDRVLYIVVYTNQQRSRGMVFSIFLDQEAAQEIFNIQNNAEFVRSTKEGDAFRKEGVDFVDGGDPLGGMWTQEHIAMAVKRIGLRPTAEVPLKGLLNPSVWVRCNSYVDIK